MGARGCVSFVKPQGSEVALRTTYSFICSFVWMRSVVQTRMFIVCVREVCNFAIMLIVVG